MLFIGILVDVMRLNLSSQIRNNYYIIQKIFIFLFATILIVWMFPNKASFKFEFQKGKPWMHETLIAPYDCIRNPCTMLGGESSEPSAHAQKSLCSWNGWGRDRAACARRVSLSSQVVQY